MKLEVSPTGSTTGSVYKQVSRQRRSFA